MRSYVTQGSFNPGAKFLILFINPNDHSTIENQRQFASELFHLMYDGYNAANVMFLYATSGDIYNIFVTLPYQNRTECGKCFDILMIHCSVLNVKTIFRLFESDFIGQVSKRDLETWWNH